MRASRAWEGTGSRHREGGAAAVEFALVVPVLLVLLFGTMQYGFYFFSLQAGNSAVREGARRAAVGDLSTCAPFTAYVRDRVGQSNFGNPVTVTRSYTKGTGNTGAGVEVGDVVRVSVTFRSLDMNVPLVPVPGDDALVTTSADTRVERVVPSTVPVSCP